MAIINVIQGNLITLAQEGNYTEIAHGCNCFRVMGAGIAPQIAKAFPEAERADNRTERGAIEKLGTFSYADITDVHEEQTLTVYNLYTQFGTMGRREGKMDLDYHALTRAFRDVNTDIKTLKDKGYYDFANLTQVLGIPMIGAGLAGGDWELIKDLINEATPDVNIEVVEYKP